MTINNGLLVIIAVLALAAVLAVAAIAKTPVAVTGTLTDSVAEDPRARSERVAFGMRGALIVVVGLLVGVSLIWLGISVPSLAGIPAVVSIGFALTAALATAALLQRRTMPPEAVAVASLEPRHWWSFARPRSVTMLGILSALTILVVVVWVLIGIAVPALSPTPVGLWIYPGAIVVMVVVLAAATYFALRRSADRPINFRFENAAQDLALRGASARIVSGMTGTVLFGYLAAIVGTIGGEISTLGHIAEVDGSPVALLSLAGVVVQVVSAGLVACSISSLAASTAVAASFVARPPEHRRHTADQVTP